MTQPPKDAAEAEMQKAADVYFLGISRSLPHQRAFEGGYSAGLKAAEGRCLTKEQAIILTGFTGITCCKFSDLHEDVERRIGHPVWTHQFAVPEFVEKVKDLYRADFMRITSAPLPPAPSEGE